jgi:hypothetical protein
LVTWDQDNQIGRIFAHWAIVYFDEFLKMTEAAQTFGLHTFSSAKVMYLFRQKWVGLHFGRFFSPTHLVALFGMSTQKNIFAF